MSTPFWTEDISQLFSLKKGFFPSSSHKLSENMNAIAKMALVACLIIACFKPVLAVSTFAIAMIVTMAIYYSTSSNEGYDVPEISRPQSVTGSVAGESPGSYSSGLAGDMFSATPNFRPLTASEFCTNKRLIPDDPSEYVSENQMLVGGPNRKTLLPIMNSTKIRSHDIDAWKTTDLTVHSAINDSNPAFDASTSGYTFFSSRNCKDCSRSPCTCMQFAAAKKMLGKRNERDFIVDDEIVDDNDLPEVTVIDKQTPSMTDIVDPRFSGYGPTDRCYIDPNSGQRKYFYSDIDSIRMPPYVSRNNIDIYPWAPKYGAGFDGRNEHHNSTRVADSATTYKGLDSVRQDALDAYRCSTNRSRQELQESLMRKRNGEMWQLRSAPIY